MRILSGLLLALCHGAVALAQEAPSQTGQLTGLVTSGGAPVEGAKVVAQGSGRSTVTDSAGRFDLTVEVGEHRLQATARGYRPGRTTVTVEAGRRAEAQLELKAQDTSRTIEVTGSLLKTSDAKQLLVRKMADEVSETVGQDEIKKTTQSDASDVAAALPGVSVVNDFVFVRGLGERYSQTLVNGQSVPSPEPDKKAVPLSLYPANLIGDLNVTKTYRPSLPGEFAGGSVQINTIDVPEAAFWKISVGFKYRDETSLRDFHTYDGGNTDAFAFEDGTRDLPGQVPATVLVPGINGLTPETQQAIGRSFRNIYDIDTQTAPLDHKFSTTFGQRWELASGGRIGVVGALNWANKYNRRRDEDFRLILNAGTTTQPEESVFGEFKLDTSTFEAETSALLNVTYEHNQAQKIGLRNFITRSAEDRTRTQEGIDFQVGDGSEIFELRYVERMIYTSQLYGEHLLIGDTFLEWRGSYSVSERDLPDLRRYRYDLDQTSGEFVFDDTFSGSKREYYYLTEDISDHGFDYHVPFNPFNVTTPNPTQADIDRLKPAQRIQIGAAYTERDREFSARRFVFRKPSAGVASDQNGDPIDLTLGPEELFKSGNISPQGFLLTEVTSASDSYDAKLELLAYYVEMRFKITQRLRFSGGVRVEDFEQEVQSIDPTSPSGAILTTGIDETSFLPAINLTYELTESMQLRVGASQTVSRPEFRELSRFTFQELTGGYSATGNPNLDQASITNYDVRWEWFPTPTSVISSSVFYKEFEDPIEKVTIPTASEPLTTWDNADKAELSGFEFEFRQNLGFLNRPIGTTTFFDNFSLRANYAYIDSEVTVSDDALFAQTNNKRPLEGQPEFTINAGLFYESQGWSAAVIAARFGESVSSVGSLGIPDEIRQPRTSLDFKISRKLQGGSLTFTVENILNEPLEWKIGRLTSRKYENHTVFGVSYSYSF